MQKEQVLSGDVKNRTGGWNKPSVHGETFFLSIMTWSSVKLPWPLSCYGNCQSCLNPSSLVLSKVYLCCLHVAALPAFTDFAFILTWLHKRGQYLNLK